MKKIVLIGAGNIGEMIIELLTSTNDYDIIVVDNNSNALGSLIKKFPKISTITANIDNIFLNSLFKYCYAVISAAPYTLSKQIASVAANNGVHYFDLTEDVESTNYIRNLENNNSLSSVLMPQCGLAPGYISILTSYLIQKIYDINSITDVKMRVGALPKHPSNALKYSLTWSVDGLINEYCNQCNAIVDGKSVLLAPLDNLEKFTIDGVDYEAFNTSGGLGTMCETYNMVDNISYRTARYPGHRDILRLLLNDLNLKNNRDVLKTMFLDALPYTLQDAVLVFVTVDYVEDGKKKEITHAQTVYSKTINGKEYSGIQITTAASICAALDMVVEGSLPNKGFIKQEQINYNDFIANRFGKYYS